MDIENNVFIKRIEKKCEFIRQQQSDFNLYLSETEKKEIVNYSVNNVDNLYNGEVVRLNSIIEYPATFALGISKVHYFDSLSSNMLYHKYAKKIEQLGNGTTTEKKIKAILTQIENEGVGNFEEVLNNCKLANTMAVSVLVKDIDGKYALVLRTKNLAVGAGMLSVTVTGALDENDYGCDNPVLACAKRELEEELGISTINNRIEYIVISKTKLQPIFIINAEISDRWQNVMHNFENAQDYKNEVKEFLVVSEEDMETLMRNHRMTDAAYFHFQDVNSRSN